MNSLIPVVNDLQKIFKTTDTEDCIKLPQIVVVGSQSCGKSSVLESLVKKSFLPNGKGIVTRCPIILQLVHSENGEEYCEFNEGMRYTNFDRVREELERQTEKMAGNNKGISMMPIIMKVLSPHVVNLTLVDLPGIVKNPVGDQPEDIEDQVRTMIMQYISNPLAIILAVSSATDDIANSESIKLAKIVDPIGERTLGVLTKLDLLEKPSDADPVLSGSIIKIQLGMLGVINKPTVDGDIESAFQFETMHFRNHFSKYGECIGSKYLATTLNNMLKSHIGKCLPELRTKLSEKIEETEKQLEELGNDITENPEAMTHLMIKKSQEYLANIKRSIDDRRQETQSQVYACFQQLKKELDNSPLFLKDITTKVNTLLKQSVNIEGFTSIEHVFKSLINEEVMLLEEPAIQCAKKVYDIFYRLAEKALVDKQYEDFNCLICQCARNVLAAELKETISDIQKFLEIQTCMIYTTDEEFRYLLMENELEDPISSDDSEEDNLLATAANLKRYVQKNSVMSPADKKVTRARSARGDGNSGCSSSNGKGIGMRTSFPLAGSGNDESFFGQCRYVELITRLYFDIVKTRVTEHVPQCIWHRLHKSFIHQTDKEIQNATLGKAEELIKDSFAVTQKRKKAKQSLQNLQEAWSKIARIQQTQS